MLRDPFPVIVKNLIFLCDFPVHFRRMAKGNDIGRNVFCHDRTGSDNGMISNCHTRQNRHIGSDPDICPWNIR